MPLATETTHIRVKYLTAVVNVNTKYHSTVVNNSVVQLGPHTRSKSIFDVEPPMMIRVTHVPPDRYMNGNRAKKFASLSPEYIFQYQ